MKINMKIIYNKVIPFGRYTSINIFGVIFTKQKSVSKLTINHEAIHTEQMKELGYVFFYIWYCIEYLIKLFKYKNNLDTYNSLSFEREAYLNDRNLIYIKTRKRYSWIKYIKLNNDKKN